MGARVAAPDTAAMAGTDGDESFSGCGPVRSAVLSVSGEPSGGWREGTEKYTSTYVFENDFAALKLDSPRFSSDQGSKGLLVAEGESGVCRVICFSPRHD